MRQPELSIVIATLDEYETIRNAIRQLRTERVKNKLEVVFVVRNAADFRLKEADLEGFHSFCIVELSDIRRTGQARAAGVMQAKALLVAFVEEHTVPDANWAEALIEAHRKPCAAVGPVMINANPETMVSWAELFLSFGPWVAPAPGGLVGSLPWHNTSYKTDMLHAYGGLLADVLETEAWVQWDLKGKGYQLYLEPAARTYHLNISRLSSYMKSNFSSGRLFGALRASYGRWSIFRRIGYMCGFLFIAVVRLPRVLRFIFRTGNAHLLPRILPPLLLGLILHSAGEGVGYTLGPGNEAEKRCDVELRRRCHLARTDKEARICN